MTMPLDEDLPQPPRRRRAPVVIACGAAVAIAGGIAITAASASGASGSGSSSGSSSSAPSAPTGSSTKTPPKPPTPKPHIDGTVKSVNGTEILVKDPEGFTRTIVTSSATKYSGGLSASPKVGTQLHAEGTVDANGTSLDATSIGNRPTPPAGGPGGGPGGHGPGMGPRGHGAPPNGTKPSGAPSGKPSGTAPAPSASTHS